MANKENELKEKSHLLAYDMLKNVAGWLENPSNEVFALLEYDDDSLNIAAKANIIAAAILKKAALDIQLISGIEDTNKYGADVGDALDNLRILANELDNSANPELCKRASVLDEILLTITSSVEEQEKFRAAMDKKIEDIKSHAQKEETKKKATDKPQVAASIDSTEGGVYRPLQAPLSTRSFPGAPGSMMARITDDVWYNINTGEQVDFKTGYMLNGKKVPGTSVEEQTAGFDSPTIPNQFK